MPLVIYTGIHAMTREPELRLPAGTQMLTLEALKAESPAAAPQPEHSDEAEKTEENQQALLLESLSEQVLESVSQWLNQDATMNKAIIVWPSPVAYIAALLADGKQSDEALEDWQQLATALLKLFRSHRRQLKLVAAEPGGESPAMDDMTLATLPVPEHSPIYTLAAKQLVDASETLTQTATRLFTSSELAYKTSEALTDQVNGALLHHQQHVQQTANLQQNLEQLKHQQAEQQAASKKQLDELTKQRDNLRQEQTQQHAASKKQLDELTKQRDNLKQEKEQQLSALQEENDMVIAELHRVQEALEKTLNERNAANKKAEELAKLKPLHESTEKELKALKQQNQSEKDAHAQTRKKLAETQTSMAGLQEENAMVIAELHRVQELLESKLYERDELVKQRDRLTHQHNVAVQQRESALQQLERRLVQLQQLHTDKKAQQLDQEALKQRLERTQKQLNVLKSEFQQALHERDAWNQWLKSHAYRFITATYRYSRAYRKTLRQQSSLINASSYFDAHWYQEQYPDLAEAKANPAEHYLKFGALEGRNPSPHFNTEFYITQYPDVATAGDNPLIHFLRHGQMERRKTNYEQLQLPSPQSSGQEATDASSQATQDEETR
ncbi:hypothetical protein OR573_12045 [Halomonas sp. CH40]